MRHAVRRVVTAPRDRGVVAILTALLMTTFLGFCAFAVDVGHWYLVKEQTQKAADAAATAGVVHIPGSFAKAQTAATQLAALNGFAVSADTTVSTVRVPGDPGSLTVTVTTTVDNFFTGLFGVSRSTISSAGTASYVGPVQMGSPCNRLGSDPDAQTASDSSACDSTSGRLWANLNAPGSAKEEGDPFNALTCVGTEDRCTGSANDERRETGYVYDVTLTKAGPLTVQVFDGPWVNLGSGIGGQCDSAALAGLVAPTEESTRYAPGAASAYCTADSRDKKGKTPRVATAMDTTFTVRSASGDPLTPESRKVLCSRTYHGYDPPDAAALTAKLTPGGAGQDTELIESFRKWSTVCSLTDAPAGTYAVQVTSTDDINAANRFSLRATTSDLSSVTIAGHGAMDLFANDASKSASFYLARVPEAGAGLTLHVQFFDLGECSPKCNITIVDPHGVAATGCTNTGSLGITGCSFTPNVTTFNGKWVDMFVPVPNDYTCNDADSASCWYRVQYAKGGPHDVTAWTADMNGQPVRIIR